MPKPTAQMVQFGQFYLPFTQLFILRKNVYATVNIKPITQGHVLVCSRRPVKRLCDLSEIETVEFWITIQEVSKVLAELYKLKCEISIQDGIDAGQTVDHVHCHILPMGNQKTFKLDSDCQPRGEEDMAQEAAKLRAHFEQSLL